MNKYGFRKVNIKKDEHIFYHPVFRSDNLPALHTIKRKRKYPRSEPSRAAPAPQLPEADALLAIDAHFKELAHYVSRYEPLR